MDSGFVARRRRRAWLVTAAAAALVLSPAAPALAAPTGGTGGLEWEAPLQALANSISGPVAFVISLIGVVICGAMLVWGGEVNEFARRFIMLVLVISVIVFAANILSTLFGVGAVIG